MSREMRRILGGNHLSEAEAETVLHALAAGEIDPAVAGAILVALRLKGETPDEVRGFARGMRALAVRPEVPASLARRAVDVVGTGGDGSGSLNLSTGSALLAAAAGLPVIKHGNGSITSRSGSADVLAELGLPMPLEPDAVGRCLEETGFTFLFAPRFHPAMKRVAGVRRALGVRTVFNLLGPLTNPAAPPYHVIGAWSEAVAEQIASCLAGLPIERAFVVHGEPGWDEPTPCGPFLLYDVRPGRVRSERRDPAVHGIPRCAPAALIGGDASFNARALRSALSDGEGPHRDALVLGAGLALEVTGAARDLGEALAVARAVIEDGRAAQLLARLARFETDVAAPGAAHTARTGTRG